MPTTNEQARQDRFNANLDFPWWGFFVILLLGAGFGTAVAYAETVSVPVFLVVFICLSTGAGKAVKALVRWNARRRLPASAPEAAIGSQHLQVLPPDGSASTSSLPESPRRITLRPTATGWFGRYLAAMAGFGVLVLITSILAGYPAPVAVAILLGAAGLLTATGYLAVWRPRLDVDEGWLRVQTATHSYYLSAEQVLIFEGNRLGVRREAGRTDQIVLRVPHMRDEAGSVLSAEQIARLVAARPEQPAGR